MRIVWLLLLCGCDKVLGLQMNPPDAAPDAPDAAIANHDEDGDGINDSLDICPTHALPGPAQPDQDMDGVGDACDPRPNEARERRVYFSPLLDLPATEWQRSSNSTWISISDGVRQTKTLQNESSYARLILPAKLKSPTVEVIMDDFSSDLMPWSAGVFLESGVETGGACYPIFPDNVLVYYESRGPIVELGYTPFASDQGRMRLTMRAGADVPRQAQCILKWGAQPTVVVESQHPPLTNVEVNLYTYQGAATFHSIFVIDER